MLPIRLFIDGTKVADGTPGEPQQVPYAVDGLSVTWGRPTSVDQPAPSTCSFTLEASATWADPDLFATIVGVGKSVSVDAGNVNDTVFLGYITDVSMSVNVTDDPSQLILSVTADDVLADLNNRPAMDVARPIEPLQTRVAGLLDTARLSTPSLVDSDIGSIPVKRVIVDEPGLSTMVAESLGNLATSVDGVLWSVGFYLEADYSQQVPGVWIESPALRPPLRRLAWVPPMVVISDDAVAANALRMSSCVPDLDPIEWRQTMSDVVTGVAVTYNIPDPTDPTRDIGATVVTVDPGAESPSKPWGSRRMAIDSQLTRLADAQLVGSKILGRLSQASWRLNNVHVDQASDITLTDAEFLQLITLRWRHGLPIVISPLPPWAPPKSDSFVGYLEGGDITSTRGVWSTNLWVSLSQGGEGVSGRWVDLPNPYVTSSWTYSVDPLDGTYRWASGAKVLTVAFVDANGVDQTSGLSAAQPGDDVQLWVGSTVVWSANIITNAVTNKVQYTVDNIAGAHPAVGTKVTLAVSHATEALGPWRWQDIDPSISWAELAGVGGPTGRAAA